MKKGNFDYFWDEVRKSLWLGLLSFFPGFLLWLFVSLSRMRLIFSPESGLNVPKEYHDMIVLISPWIKLYDSFLELLPDRLEKLLSYSLLSILLLAIFVVYLRLINPAFGLKGFSVKKWWKNGDVFSTARIAEYFLVSLVVVVFLAKMILPYSFLGAILVSNGLFWILWHRKGFFGKLEIFDYQKRGALSPWNFRLNVKQRDILKIFILSLFFSFFLFLIQSSINYILDRGQLLISYLLTYRTWFSLFDHIKIDFIAFSLLFLVLPMAYFLSDFSLDRKRLQSRMTVPLIAILVFSGIVFNYVIFFGTMVDMDKSAFKLVNIEKDAISARTLFILEQEIPEKRKFKAEVNFRTIDLKRKVSNEPGDPRLHTEKIPCTLRNDQEVRKIYEIARSKDFDSALLDAYLSYSSGKAGFPIVYGCKLFNFEIKGILEDKVLALRKSLNPMNLMAFLLITGKLGQSIIWINYDIYLKLSDYFDSLAWDMDGRIALSKWHRYNGVIKDAKAANFDGNIKGRLIFKGNALSLQETLIKVALLTPDSDKIEKRGISTVKIKEGVFLDGYSLMAMARINPEGYFSFEHLLEGNYVMAILFEGDPEIGIVKKKPLGQISINASLPKVELGDVVIE